MTTEQLEQALIVKRRIEINKWNIDEIRKTFIRGETLLNYVSHIGSTNRINLTEISPEEVHEIVNRNIERLQEKIDADEKLLALL